MIRIFSIKSFIFSNGEDEVKVRNHEMTDVPKWVANTKLFKLAEIDGDIQVMESKVDQREVEKSNTTTKGTKKKEEKEKSSAEKE